MNSANNSSIELQKSIAARLMVIRQLIKENKNSTAYSEISSLLEILPEPEKRNIYAANGGGFNGQNTHF